jgi:hypothetical protein
MGMFPYTCELCGGGYSRCVYGGHPPDSYTGAKNDYKGTLDPCKDGQFCWEDNCIISSSEILHVPNGITAPDLKSIPRMRAIYDGYGCFDIDEMKYPACKDYKFVSIDFDTSNMYRYIDQVVVRVIAFCSSCYGDFELEA